MTQGTRRNEYTGRHASPRRKTARTRAGKAVPVAVAAAALAAGAAAYTLVPGGHPQAPQLNAAMTQLGAASASVAGRGHADASATIKPGTTSHPTASHTASHPAAATAAATPSAPRRSFPAHSQTATQPTAAPQATPTSSSKSTSTSASKLSCDLSVSMLPENVTAIVSFLLAHGYSDNAAAGIAGNMYQESKGNPESVGSGGGGLIGWTPLKAGLITGNAAADLQTQLAAVLVYNEGWSSYIPALNNASSPAAAADIYVTDFERAGIPAASTREASATNVARACGI